MLHPRPLKKTHHRRYPLVDSALPPASSTTWLPESTPWLFAYWQRSQSSELACTYTAILSSGHRLLVLLALKQGSKTSKEGRSLGWWQAWVFRVLVHISSSIRLFLGLRGDGSGDDVLGFRFRVSWWWVEAWRLSMEDVLWRRICIDVVDVCASA